MENEKTPENIRRKYNTLFVQNVAALILIHRICLMRERECFVHTENTESCRENCGFMCELKWQKRWIKDKIYKQILYISHEFLLNFLS